MIEYSKALALGICGKLEPSVQCLTGQVFINVLIGDNGLPELNGCLVDFIEAGAEVGPKVRLRLLQLKLEQFVILIVRSLMYRELKRQVIIVVVTSRRCQVYPYACLTNAMRGYDEGILALSNGITCLRQG